MNDFKIRRMIVPLFMATCLVLVGTHRSNGRAPGLRLAPDIITIGAFFDGARISASAEIPAGCDAIFEVSGKSYEQELLRKGRRWELWMNVGEIDIEGAPGLYLVTSSRPDLPDAVAVESGMGYQALEQSVSFKGKLQEQIPVDELFKEFVRLKESHGLYGSYPGKVEIKPEGDGLSLARADFRIPVRVSPGTYQVCFAALRDGRVTARQCRPLHIKRVGLPAFLNSLAHRRAALYGLLAIAIAVVAGFLTGAVFKKVDKGEKC